MKIFFKNETFHVVKTYTYINRSTAPAAPCDRVCQKHKQSCCNKTVHLYVGRKGYNGLYQSYI